MTESALLTHQSDKILDRSLRKRLRFRDLWRERPRVRVFDSYRLRLVGCDVKLETSVATMKTKQVATEPVIGFRP